MPWIVPFPLVEINFVYRNNVANYKRKRLPKSSNIFYEHLNLKICGVDCTRALAGNRYLTRILWPVETSNIFSLFVDFRKLVFKMPQDVPRIEKHALFSHRKVCMIRGAAGSRRPKQWANCYLYCYLYIAPFGEFLPPIVTFQALFCQHRDNIITPSHAKVTWQCCVVNIPLLAL